MTGDITLSAKLSALPAPTAADFTFTPPSDLTYDGTAKTAAVTPNNIGIGTVTVYYYNANGEQVYPIDAGTYTVKINVALGTDYGAVANVTDSTWMFTIAPMNITGASVGTFKPLTYDGTLQTPVATVTKDGLTVTGSWIKVRNVTDKTVFTASGNFTGAITGVNPGMAKATPNYTIPTGIIATYGQTLANVTLPAGFTWNAPSTGVGNVGTRTFTATFTPADTANYITVNNVNVSVEVKPKNITFDIDAIAAVIYNGAAYTPAPVVKDGTTTLIKDTDYTVSYSDNINAGTATVTVTGKGNYDGSSGSVTFNINRADVTNRENNRAIVFAGESYDVSQLFVRDENAGAAAYTLETGGTGEGTLAGNNLTVTKAGTFTIYDDGSDRQLLCGRHDSFYSDCQQRRADGTHRPNQAEYKPPGQLGRCNRQCQPGNGVQSRGWRLSGYYGRGAFRPFQRRVFHTL